MRSQLEPPIGKVRPGELRTLGASGCQINDISALASALALSYVFLAQNQITDVSPLLNHPDLEQLTLADNPLTEATSLASLTHLSSLDLSGTQISELPNWRTPSEVGCRDLIAERTSLSQNTLENVFPELCQKWGVNVWLTGMSCRPVPGD